MNKKEILEYHEYFLSLSEVVNFKTFKIPKIRFVH